MGSHAKSRWRQILSAVLSFLISFLAFVLVLLIVMTSTVFGSKFMMKMFDRSNYYEMVMTELESEFGYIAEPAGVDAELLVSAIDINTLKKDIRGNVRAAYRQVSYQTAAGTLQTQIYDNLKAYAQSQQLMLDEQLDANLQNVASAAAGQYDKHVQFPLIRNISDVTHSMKKPVAVAMIGLMVVLFVLICSLFFMQKWKHRAMRGLIYALSGTGLMLAVFPAGILLSGKLKYISISQESLYRFTITYVETILKNLVWIGGGFLLVSLLLGIFVYRKMYQTA